MHKKLMYREREMEIICFLKMWVPSKEAWAIELTCQLKRSREMSGQFFTNVSQLIAQAIASSIWVHL
jgi:hypothetical protein